MNLSILTHEHASISDFVTFWQKQYDYGNEETYQMVLNKPDLTPEDITALFNWKNNIGKGEDRLSNNKKLFVQKVMARMDKVNQLKKSFDLDQYMEHFDDLPAIWGTTLLHVISSGMYPIYDQHVHRAFTYCSKGILEEMPGSNGRRYKVYLQCYVPFFDDLRKQLPSWPAKQIDDALWAFGKFLRRYPKMISSDIRQG